MSENGPREGARDLPRRDPDAGRRAVDPDSLAGRAYGSAARLLRRRREDLRELAEQRLSPEAIIDRFDRDHPAEHPATLEEVRAVIESLAGQLRDSSKGRPATAPTGRDGL